MVEKYLKLNENQKTIFWLAIIGAVVFIGLCPLFFFYEIKGYSYPIGWVLGTLAEILSFWTIIKMSEAAIPQEKGADPKALNIVFYIALRFILYIVVLTVAAICTFTTWFGAFSLFNFWTTFAGLLPVQIYLFVRHLKRG